MTKTFLMSSISPRGWRYSSAGQEAFLHSSKTLLPSPSHYLSLLSSRTIMEVHIMNVGNHSPNWRIPTFVNGQLAYLPLRQFRGTRVVLCCLGSIAEDEARLFNSQTERFAEFWSRLTVFVSHDPLLKALPTKQLLQFRPPLLTDPLRRLGQALSLSRSLPPNRCETLFFDQQCRLEFRLIHDLNLRGLNMALEMAKCLACQCSSSEPSEPLFESKLIQPNYGETTYSKALPG